MLKEGELIGAFALSPPRSSLLTDKQIGMRSASGADGAD